MGLSVEVGTGTAPTATGAADITLADTGLTPKVAIIASVGMGTVATLDTQCSFGIGWSAGGAGTGYAAASSSGTAGADFKVHDDDGVMIVPSPYSGVILHRGEIDTGGFSAGSVDLTWPTASATARKYAYLVLGGTDLSSVGVEDKANPGSVTDVDWTGGGFDPDLVLVTEGAGTTTQVSSSNSVFAFGAASSTTERAATSWITSSQPNMRTGSRDDEILYRSAATSSAVLQQADITDMAQGSGFTLGYTVSSSAGNQIGALSLAGALQTQVGEFAASTSTGTQQITGLGFQPVALILWSECIRTTNGNGSNDMQTVFGMSDFTNHRCCMTINELSGADADRFYSESYIFYAVNGNTHTTVEGTATWSARDSDSFTLDWSDAAAAGYRVNYLAIGEAAAASGLVGPLTGHGGLAGLGGLAGRHGGIAA